MAGNATSARSQVRGRKEKMKMLVKLKERIETLRKNKPIYQLRLNKMNDGYYWLKFWKYNDQGEEIGADITFGDKTTYSLRSYGARTELEDLKDIVGIINYLIDIKIETKKAVSQTEAETEKGPVKFIEVKDKFNSSKIWLVKIYKNSEVYINQRIAPSKKPFYKRYSKASYGRILQIGKWFKNAVDQERYKND